MATVDDWVARRVAAARKPEANVTPAAAARIEALLSAELSERQHSTAELKAVALVLLADMVPATDSPRAGS
jgi:hypothetical protein